MADIGIMVHGTTDGAIITTTMEAILRIQTGMEGILNHIHTAGAVNSGTGTIIGVKLLMIKVIEKKNVREILMALVKKTKQLQVQHLRVRKALLFKLMLNKCHRHQNHQFLQVHIRMLLSFKRINKIIPNL